MSPNLFGPDAHLLEARTGIVPVGRVPQRAATLAVRRSLPTMDHAARLLAATRAALGARAWDDASGAGRVERVHVGGAHGPEWVSALPLVELLHGPDEDLTVATLQLGAGAPPAAEAPRPQLRPRGPNMHLGEFTIRDGASAYIINYDAEGLLTRATQAGGDQFMALKHGAEMPPCIDPLARPPTEPPPALLCRDDLAADGHPIDALAKMIAATDVAARAPALVRLPVPVPTGATGVWEVARAGIRRALFEGEVDADARFIVADGLAGTAVAWGASLEDALERWQGALFRAKPKPPAPAPEPGAPPEINVKVVPAPGARDDAAGEDARDDAGADETGGIHQSIRIVLRGAGGGGSAVPWPAAVPDQMPAGALPLPPLPAAPPEAFARAGFTAWVRLVDGEGRVRHALARDDPGGAGVALVGEGLLDLVDPATLDDELTAAEVAGRAADTQAAAQAGVPSFWDAPITAVFFALYACWDDVRHVRLPLQRRFARLADAFDPNVLDGQLAAYSVTRVRTLGLA